MKSLIITGATEDMFPVLDLTLESKQKYASKHNYDLLVKRSWNGVAKFHFTQYEDQLLGYHKPLLGILGFLRVLICFEQLKDYDVVMWLDGDSVVTNSDITIEEIINDDNACFFASYDWAVGVRSFSTGNFAIKRHSKTQEVYEQFLETSKSVIGNIMQEQRTLNLIFSVHSNLSSCLKIVPRKFLNSVPKTQEQMNTWKGRPTIEEPWNSECFIAHLTGLTQEERLSILTNGTLTYK